MIQHNANITDTYLGAEGDVHALGIGLKWLQDDRLAQLHDRLQEKRTKSAQTWLMMLDHLADGPTAEHIELARRAGCTPEELQRRNGKISQLIREKFTGSGWPIGWHRGEARAGEVPGAWIYEIHLEVGQAWKGLRVSGS